MATWKLCYEEYSDEEFCRTMDAVLTENDALMIKISDCFDAAVEVAPRRSAISMSSVNFELAKARAAMAQWKADYWNYVLGKGDAKTAKQLYEDAKDCINAYANVFYEEDLV